ncbi:uncharacterized protein LOC130815584 [Amaranthus tricolor]|uniref:uncharacterized protein LOC130815584 n=1 Tax=Amaranthus tricolor TaxID=29722 RepID=UPI0025841280|nr:uncharacterized protein LOC130815584 [Amaranthus tricolor]
MGKYEGRIFSPARYTEHKISHGHKIKAMLRGRGRQLSTEIEGRGMDSQYRRLEATNERLLKFLRIRIIRVNWTKKIASFYLEDTASMWWKTMKAKQDNIGMTWEEFLVRLRNRFYPISLQRRKKGEFLTLSQEKMSVLEYSGKFMELSRFAPDFIANDRMKASRFFEGLNLNLQKFNRERGKQVVYPSKKTKIESLKFQYQKPSGKQTWSRDLTRQQRKEIWVCPKCSRKHYGEDCQGKRLCFTCGQLGLITKDCPKGGNLNKIPLGNKGGKFNNNQRVVGRMYAMEGESKFPDECEPQGNVISGVLKVRNKFSYVLFDIAADYCFISHKFLKKLKFPLSFVSINLKVGIFDGSHFSCNKLYKNCPIEISPQILIADLVEFELGE